MADEGKSGGNAGLAFIVGGLVVVVIIIGWFLFSGGGAVEAPTRDVDVEISVPDAPSAPAAD